MAEQGVLIVDKTIQKEMGGIVDYEEDFWYILLSQNNLKSQGYGIIEKIKKNNILFMILSVCSLLLNGLLDLTLYDQINQNFYIHWPFCIHAFFTTEK